MEAITVPLPHKNKCSTNKVYYGSDSGTSGNHGDGTKGTGEPSQWTLNEFGNADSVGFFVKQP